MKEANLKIYCDGGARGNPGPAACAFVVFKEGKKIHQDSKFLGKTTNNFAEYMSVRCALQWLYDNKNNEEQIIVVLDSELVTKQLRGLYKVKSPKLKLIFNKVKILEGKLNAKLSYQNVPRSRNKMADLLVNKELDKRRVSR